MSKAVFFLMILWLIISCNNKNAEESGIQNSPISIMAYYVPGGNFTLDELPLEKLTHLIFSFSKVVNGEMKFSREELGITLKELVQKKQTYPHLKVMVACGGWGADGFSDAALTAESRSRFIKSAVHFIEEYQLDGLDIDWEYPGISGAGTVAREADKVNFTALMKGLREELDKLNRPQTLTFASAGWKRYYNHVELNKLMKYADYMNVMTYDQAGGGSRYTAHHTALGNVSVDNILEFPLGKAMQKRNENLPENVYNWEPQSAEKIIQFCIEQGVKPEQLVVGAAFYGRGWKGVPPKNNGLYQANGGPISEGTNYYKLQAEFKESDGFEKHWDTLAKAPFLYHRADSIFVTYDNQKSVQLKTRFVKEKKLGGIMFWQLSGDTKDETSLLKAIYDEALAK